MKIKREDGKKEMQIEIKDDFDLWKIADSGQCFRFNKCGDGYSVVAGDKYVFVWSTWRSSCFAEDFADERFLQTKCMMGGIR